MRQSYYFFSDRWSGKRIFYFNDEALQQFIGSKHFPPQQVCKRKTMINNQSDKPEKFEPKDSGEKKIKHPQDDNEAVVKPDDKTYDQDNANFGNVAKRHETEEQPVKPGDQNSKPKDV
ncbi:hypothetical protein GS399_17455 [Pedobacter sp. HMF7647]|uniref:Uncharacterized protein n=1 Tax=Hufsiella arboris TaxID=2695275 RepID=A0A7K1YDT1_9SPHI|nr:hypothetical protein [Hufsiella arboris]MXV52763.1 hypothetical protein [Hufsiella arboris]